MKLIQWLPDLGSKRCFYSYQAATINTQFGLLSKKLMTNKEEEDG